MLICSVIRLWSPFRLFRMFERVHHPHCQGFFFLPYAAGVCSANRRTAASCGKLHGQRSCVLFGERFPVQLGQYVAQLLAVQRPLIHGLVAVGRIHRLIGQHWFFFAGKQETCTRDQAGNVIFNWSCLYFYKYSSGQDYLLRQGSGIFVICYVICNGVIWANRVQKTCKPSIIGLHAFCW